MPRKSHAQSATKSEDGSGEALVLKEEEVFVLNVQRLLEEHPLFKDGKLKKPGADYLISQLADQPELQRLTDIERREHLLNVVILGYFRDVLFVDAVNAKEKYGDEWRKYFKAKDVRLVKDIVKEQEKILPDIFKESDSEFSEKKVGRRIVKKLTEEIIEFTETEEPPKKLAKEEFKVVD